MLVWMQHMQNIISKSCGAIDFEWSQLVITRQSDNRNSVQETILKFTLEHDIQNLGINNYK
jgi:hypothetical protein